LNSLLLTVMTSGGVIILEILFPSDIEVAFMPLLPRQAVLFR